MCVNGYLTPTFGKEVETVNKHTTAEKIFTVFNTIFMFLVCATMLYPFLNCIAKSISSNEMVMSGQVLIWPKDLNIIAYKQLFKDSLLFTSFFNTLFVVTVGTSLRMILTVLAAYAFSKRDLIGAKYLFGIFIITMYFSGGMIPTFLIIKGLYLYDTLWALILPGAVTTFFIILARSYFEQIPVGVEESALIDGANYFKVLFGIILPISKPILSTLMIFYIVGLWNIFMPAILYTQSSSKYTLQVYVRQMVFFDLYLNVADTSDAMSQSDMLRFGTETLRMAILCVTSIPILLVYPFFQKYFIKGVTLGAVKG